MKIPHLLLGLTLPLLTQAAPEAPRPTDPQLQVQLVAAEPDVRTPTAIQVDPQGRIWVLENNTHFRPKTYDASPTDRVLILENFGADGRAQKITTFADGFRDGMGLLLQGPGDVIVSTRAEILRLRDTNGDGSADQRQTLLALQTEDKYPHNGMSGMARDAAGLLFIGLGENHGKAWTLTGTDGITLAGSDEGGVFRFDPEGRGLTWWALGFWNPFGLSFDRDGRLFALDNDPSGGSLCRLVHVVPGGDYGFRYRYGRTIQHPFVAWRGELPGTLPPVCLSGEAPTGLIHFGSSALGPVNAGQLLGATWTDHGIQRFPLAARGVSFDSKPEWLLRGGHEFRPSGLAEAPDGSLVISDWADGSYEVHGKGRVWRLLAKAPSQPAPVPAPVLAKAPSPAHQLFADLLAGQASAEKAFAALTDPDPFIQRAAILALARLEPAQLVARAASGDVRSRVGVLLALRRGGSEAGRALLPTWLADSDGVLRRAALHWISEEGLQAWLPKLDVALTGQPSRETFQAYLAAVQMLTSGKPDPKATVEQTLAVALDPQRSADLRALALHLLPPLHPTLRVEQLRELMGEASPVIRLEAVRILAARPDPAAQAELRRVASDAQTEVKLRAEALAGLVQSAVDPQTQALLQAGVNGDPVLAREARRSLGQSAIDAQNPSAGPIAPGKILQENGNAEAGRRLFYHPNGPRCSVCHAVDGRGGAVGPELTQIGRLSPELLLEAIREPSKEVAPAFGTWHVQMKNGTEFLGIDQFEDNKAQTILVDAAGTRTQVKFAEMVVREPLPISLMPPGLDAPLTVAELRDLLAFLREAR